MGDHPSCTNEVRKVGEAADCARSTCEGLGLYGEGGRRPLWSEGGSELFFWQGSTLMASRVSVEEGVFRWEPPRRLFDVPGFYGAYGVTPDGERFLVKIGNPEAWIREIHVVLNWLEVLRAQEGT